MTSSYKRSSGERPEITNLDAHILEGGGTSSTIDMIPCSLQKAKEVKNLSTRDLILENSYLRQEIVYYKQSREAMMAFHNDTLKSFQLLQTALKELSHRMAMSEECMLRYWGIDMNKIHENDITVF